MNAINYNIEVVDLLAFSEFDWQRSDKAQRSLHRHKTLWPVLLLAIGIFFLIVVGRPDTTLRFGLLAIAWGVLVPMAVRKYLRWCARKASTGPEWQRLVGEHGLELQDDSLVATAPDDVKERIHYTAMKSIEMTDRHIFLYLATESALIIPRMAVQPQKLNKFVEKIRAKLPSDSSAD